MQLIIKEDNLTVSYDLTPEEGCEISAEQALIAAYDIISRVFPLESVIRAYYRTDPDTMSIRDDDDEFFKHVKFFGYDDPKED